MSKMTAEKARDLARSKDPDFAVDTILADIAKAAEQGKYELVERGYGFGTSTYCNAKDYPELCKAILRELRSLGYRCEVQAVERQFVDMWLEIRWDEVPE